MPKLTLDQLRDHLEQELAMMNQRIKRTEHGVEELNMRDDRLVMQVHEFKKEFRQFRSEVQLKFTEMERSFTEFRSETEQRFTELFQALDSYFTNLEKQLRELKRTQ